MQKQETQKVLVVFQSDTLIDPNTVVVSFFDTHLAQRTVFAASRLVKLASFTLLFWLEHQIIILEAFEGLMFG
jgi:hypothetical protein